jgi:hypothetical protein
VNDKQRGRLVHTIVDVRAGMPHKWDATGIEAALMVVAQQNPNDFPAVVREAIRWSLVPSARTPKVLHDRELQGQLAPQATAAPKAEKVAPAHDDPVCPKCGSQVVRSDGSCHGCWLNALEDGTTAPKPVSPAPSVRRCGPPPAEIKDRIERDFQVRRAAKARSEG